ncbi:MAG: fatty acid desaturase family protein [Pseudomonadota bacterium]
MASAEKISDYLTKRELRTLSKPRDLRAVGSLLLNWALIAVSFAIAIIWTSPITILLGILLLGGRQLGLGILNHDCAHHSLFKSKSANNFVGHWLCGAPINVSVYAYRTYHLKHHRHAGTIEDPDRIFVANYPISSSSLKRKLVRDVTGQTGFRDLVQSLRSFKISKNYPWLIFHMSLLCVLTLIGAPWAYLMWWGAELFIYPALTRIRQIGEHGVAIDRDSLDPRDNTSTTLTSWWEKLLIAPNNVNYHLEHHHFAAVPGYNLPKLHRLLSERGYYKQHDCISNGYLDVLRRAVKSHHRTTAAA